MTATPFTSVVVLISLSGSRVRAQTADDADLASSTRLETILRVALDRNRDLAESQARALAADARGRAAARLPDPELKYEQWGVPLSRPYALDSAQTLMIGVRQTFPAWGSLAARGRAAAEEAGSAQDAARAGRQEVAAQVRRAFTTYYKADQELRLHIEHVGLTSRALELARLNQRTGHGGLQDVLRLELELTRLHAGVARLEAQQRSSRALLNALMDRSPDALLGPPEDLKVASATDASSLERSIDANRPEIGVAARAVHRSEAVLDGARRSARFPNVMVGVDYWYMPSLPPEMRHAYGAMVGINLPWLSGRHDDEQREAEHAVQAERHALASAKNTVRYQLRDAAARLESARRSFALIDQEMLAQARRGFEVAQAQYAAGQGDVVGLLDALRSYLEVRIERVSALAELATSEADVERAAGTLAVAGAHP